ncbi:CHY zinc finger protein [Hymenobacter sp. PAMC 26628]|uniref:CHY zinc finger protein n=1 Tax=Hymenobacter sp. PAMC 26628 TaxID=1484118 RepID=UPI00194DEC1B|nr:CHY zinc finger protein [Hymenobacter sp. PAMC 26628]
MNERTQCAHYHSDRDLIAIKFKCCNAFYACIQCHNETVAHAPVVWGKAERAVEAILCGNCHYTLSIAEYFACGNTCPRCQAAFNPGCANHYDLYFEM